MLINATDKYCITKVLRYHNYYGPSMDQQEISQYKSQIYESYQIVQNTLTF